MLHSVGLDHGQCSAHAQMSGSSVVAGWIGQAHKARLCSQSYAPFLSVAQAFPCKLISIVYDPKLPAVNCNHCSDVQHVGCDVLITAALEERLAVLDVILH